MVAREVVQARVWIDSKPAELDRDSHAPRWRGSVSAATHSELFTGRTCTTPWVRDPGPPSAHHSRHHVWYNPKKQPFPLVFLPSRVRGKESFKTSLAFRARILSDPLSCSQHLAGSTRCVAVFLIFCAPLLFLLATSFIYFNHFYFFRFFIFSARIDYS